MAGQACARVVAEWNQVIEEFLVSGLSIPPPMTAWAGSYSGKGAGEVDADAMPEPYLGSLDGQPAGVFLALNPGGVNQQFQHRQRDIPDGDSKGVRLVLGVGGILAIPARSVGARGRTQPASPEPVEVPSELARGTFADRGADGRLRALPVAQQGNHRDDETGPRHRQALGVGASRRAERTHFRIGAPWFDILENKLGLTPIVHLGRAKGHIDYPTSVASRRITVYLDEC